MNARLLTSALAVGLLAVMAFAVPAQAQDNSTASDPASDHKGPDCSKAPDPAKCKERMANAEKAKEKRDDMREKANATYHAKCDQPANATVEKRCENVRKFMDRDMRAMREARALMGALHALERQKARLEIREKILEDKLNKSTSANETAHLQKRLDNVREHLAKVDAKIEKLEDRIAKLREKFQEIRQKFEDRREAKHNGTAPPSRPPHPVKSSPAPPPSSSQAAGNETE